MPFFFVTSTIWSLKLMFAMITHVWRLYNNKFRNIIKMDVIRMAWNEQKISDWIYSNYQINLKFCKCVSGSWLLQGALKNKLVLLQTYQIPRNREPSIRMEFKKRKKIAVLSYSSHVRISIVPSSYKHSILQ